VAYLHEDRLKGATSKLGRGTLNVPL
jgi:hypothetical protein